MDTALTEKAQNAQAFSDLAVSTPSFVIFEEAVLRNLRRTIEASGGADRLVPHVKTHRADWIVRLSLREGIKAFKCATPAEVEMVLDAGAASVIWAYPSVNTANIMRVLAVAKKHRPARVTALVDSMKGLAAWRACLSEEHANVDLRVDLDVGMGRTGVPITREAESLARAIYDEGRFAGWHTYDGHIKGKIDERRRIVRSNADQLTRLMNSLRSQNIASDLIAGGSYTFNLWPADVAKYVSPGSWTYSSSQHHEELAELQWEQAAFVMTTVTSAHGGTATFDAGAKAIAPDKPVGERFHWNRKILSMSEEHTVVEADHVSVGDRLLLTPRHACTTAYLYNEGLVRTSAGTWETRKQLGCTR